MKHEACSACGTMSPVVTADHRFDDMGIPVILKNVEVVQCPNCGNEDPIIPNLNDLMNALALGIICCPRKLTGSELKFLRNYVGKTQREFGQLLHFDSTHISNLENNQEEIGKSSDKYVRLLVLSMSPELREKVDRLIKLLPEIKDLIPCREPEISYDPATRELLYA